jgi:RNA polymerase sigma-70 factor, ECF subfamily
VRIVRKRRRLAKARRLDAYVYRIARNEAISHVRHRSRARSDGAIASPWLVASNDGRERAELVDLIENALGRLPDSQRQVVVLKVYRGKTLREIGDLLSIPLNTAASRSRYAMEKLRALPNEQLS